MQWKCPLVTWRHIILLRDDEPCVEQRTDMQITSKMHATTDRVHNHSAPFPSAAEYGVTRASNCDRNKQYDLKRRASQGRGAKRISPGRGDRGLRTEGGVRGVGDAFRPTRMSIMSMATSPPAPHRSVAKGPRSLSCATA